MGGISVCASPVRASALHTRDPTGAELSDRDFAALVWVWVEGVFPPKRGPTTFPSDTYSTVSWYVSCFAAMYRVLR